MKINICSNEGELHSQVEINPNALFALCSAIEFIPSAGNDKWDEQIGELRDELLSGSRRFANEGGE